METYNGKPLLEATLEEWNLGIYCLSLVGRPATEKRWMLFSKQDAEKPQGAYLRFAITDADEHKVLSVIMLADTPIFRIDENGNEFYIEFSKDEIGRAHV